MTSMRRNDVAWTSFRRHVPARFLRNQCQISIFLILKSDIVENSRIELRGMVLPAPSNQIKVTFIIILAVSFRPDMTLDVYRGRKTTMQQQQQPFNLVHLWFLPVSHRNWRKRLVDYCGGGQRVCCSPPLSLKLFWGGGLAPPPSSYAYEFAYSWFVEESYSGWKSEPIWPSPLTTGGAR